MNQESLSNSNCSPDQGAIVTDPGKILAHKVNELASKQAWFHHFALPHGVETRPHYTDLDANNTGKWKRIEPLLKAFDVNGKRVLDVGCSEGYFSTKMAEMGANGLGIDADEHCIEKANFVKDALGIISFDFKQVDIYSREFEELQPFNLTLCLGFLHRIPDPYTAIAKLVNRSDAILFEWKTLRHPLVTGTYAYMKREQENKDNIYSTRYWSLSYECLEWILTRLGYSHFRRIQDEHTSRAILIAGRVDNPVFAPQKGDIIRKNRFKKIFDQTKHYLRLVGRTVISN